MFAGRVVRERGFVGDAAVEAFLAAGYTQQNVLEVVLGAGTKLLSNYTNHIVHTELDPFMKGAEWTKPGSSSHRGLSLIAPVSPRNRRFPLLHQE